MGIINAEAKKIYSEKVRIYKQEIDQIRQREKGLLQVLEKSGKAEQFQRINLAEDRLNLASRYLLLNRISVAMLGIKNEAFLNDARKSCYESIIHLEKIVTDAIDVPFSDLQERWESIENISEPNRYSFMCKLGFTIDSVTEDFGENTKWKWSFVDLGGRYAVVFKNFINFKTLLSGMDPRVPHYQVRVNMLNRVKQLLIKSADDFRLKYELSTNRMDDFKTAITFLSALRRIYIVLGEIPELEKIKKKLELWKHKMEDDERNKMEDNERSKKQE